VAKGERGTPLQARRQADTPPSRHPYPPAAACKLGGGIRNGSHVPAGADVLVLVAKAACSCAGRVSGTQDEPTARCSDARRPAQLQLPTHHRLHTVAAPLLLTLMDGPAIQAVVGGSCREGGFDKTSGKELPQCCRQHCCAPSTTASPSATHVLCATLPEQQHCPAGPPQRSRPTAWMPSVRS
jgi:hypothetical protein